MLDWLIISVPVIFPHTPFQNTSIFLPIMAGELAKWPAPKNVPPLALRSATMNSSGGRFRVFMAIETHGPNQETLRFKPFAVTAANKHSGGVPKYQFYFSIRPLLSQHRSNGADQNV